MSDFNTEDSRREPSAVSSVVGLYGLGETNEGGDQLEDFCLEYELALANTMFKQHPRQCILGQLSLASLRGRLIEYRLRLG